MSGTSRRGLTKIIFLAAVCLFGPRVVMFGASAEPTKSPNLPFSHVIVEGNKAVSDKEIVKILNLKKGKKTNLEKIQIAVDRLQTAYINRGFLLVEISTQIEPTPDKWLLSLHINEGPLHRLGTFTIQGHHEISEKSIRNEFEIKSGEPFSHAKLIEGNKRLYGAGAFDFVDVLISTVPGYIVNVNVKVRERTQRFVKGGTGYGTETKERLSVGFEDQNFMGGARRADIKYTYSGFLTDPEKFETRTLEGNLTQPFIFNSRMEGQLSLEHSTKFRESYDSVEDEIRASVERRFSAASSIKLTYRLQGTNLTRVSPEAETPSETSVNAPGVTLRFDNTDHPFLPFSGWRTIESFEEGLRLLKNDVGFHKLQGRIGRFDTIESGWTFFEGFQAGIMLPRSGKKTDVIPINERFFLGGANTVRGFSERDLGPKDESGDPLGGTFFVVGNAEVRHRLFKKIFGVMFFDAGQLFDYDPGDANPQIKLRSFGDLEQSCGVGIRLHSPVGAIRLEGGYHLNPEGSPHFTDRTALHFSLGEVF